MSAALVLDQYNFPETGTVELNLNISFLIRISAEQARRQVSKWLFHEVSYMLIAEMPTLSIGAQVVWRVPIVLTASHIGKVGNVGYVDVNVESGTMDVTATTKEKVIAKARCLAETMPPYTSRKASGNTMQPTLPEANRFQPHGDPQQILQKFSSTSVR